MLFIWIFNFLTYFPNMDQPQPAPESWGFYGHRLINQMAVYCLPPEMFGYFKKNILFLTEHAIDPDKRRYATKHEGVRHYIDIDHWDKIPFPNVPRDFEEAIIKHASFLYIDGKDTVVIESTMEKDSFFVDIPKSKGQKAGIDFNTLVKYWKKVIKPMYYEDEWVLNMYDLDDLFDTNLFTRLPGKLIIQDNFSSYGIVPYHLEAMLEKITYSFQQADHSKLLRYLSEFGHYVADAHVPLHTTENYNGQMTNQVGIHAFWESRIPELFAENSYDFFVGQAEYIENPREYIWNMVITAHSHLDSVLSIEKRLSKGFPLDRQYCYDERLSQTVRIQCAEYAEAYSNAMGSMVEDQMRASIHAIGSLWYTAWVNAGQPDLSEFKPQDYTPEEIMPDKQVQARQHDNR